LVSKKILIIAGPNGAGKTTTALELISNSPVLYEFINADEIARGLAPKHPESMALTASKLMITRLKELLENSKNFAFETTLSGKNYEKHLKEAKSNGYDVLLFFLWLSSPEQAIKRVAQRVSQGGHHVEEDVIARRYRSGLKNLFESYLPLSDNAIIINNSTEDSKESTNNLIARKSTGDEIEVLNQEIWEKMNKVAYER